MRPLIIGIGGTGGKILKEFLESLDVLILGKSVGEHVAFGGIKGIWIEADTASVEDKFYAGRLENGRYPGFIVPSNVLKADSKLYNYIRYVYGHDLRRPGFDRRAEYMKAIFEIFETDPIVKNLAKEEYEIEDNPLMEYIWNKGISRFTSFKKSEQTSEQAPGGETSPDLANKRAPASNISEEGGMMTRISALTRALKGANVGDDSKVCDSLLIITSLGGGTGTGFINPLTNYLRKKGSFAAIAVCIFAEKKPDAQFTTEEHRDLAAVIAMYDLLTKSKGKGIDGLILIDNQILQDLYGPRNYSDMNKAIFDALRPFIDQQDFPDVKKQAESLAMQRAFSENLLETGVLIPCYSSGDSSKSETDLVKDALSRCKKINGKPEGILFPCDYKKADRAYIFARGLLHRDKLEEELKTQIGKDSRGMDKTVNVYPKLGEKNSSEILILLRNPFGKETHIFSKDDCEERCNDRGKWEKEVVYESFEQRLYCAICMGRKYLESAANEQNIIEPGMPAVTKVSLGNYLFGEEWIDRKLNLLQEKTDLSEEEKEFKDLLEEAKNKYLEMEQPFLLDELEKSMDRLQKGETPIFVQELTIFGKDKSEIQKETLMGWIKSSINEILDERGYNAKAN